MKARIRKWGNGLAIQIPSSLATDLGLTAGTLVDLEVSQGRLRVVAAKSADCELERLVAGINEANIHDEIATGSVVMRNA